MTPQILRTLFYWRIFNWHLFAPFFGAKLCDIKQYAVENIHSGAKYNFTLYDVLKSHLSHKRTRRPYSERKYTHNDTRNVWDMFYRFKDKFMERSAFFLTLFALSRVQNQIFTPSNVLTLHLKYKRARYYSEFQEQYLWILLSLRCNCGLDA